MKVPPTAHITPGASEQPRPEGWYLFGVLPAEDGHTVDREGFGAPVQIVRTANLGAIVGRVAPEVFVTDESVVDLEGLADPAQLTELIVEHDQVLRAAVQTGRAVVPVPFGLVTASLEELHRLLSEHASQLHGALARLEGCDEWGVHVSVPREAAQRAVRSCARQVYEGLAAVSDDAVIEPVNAGAREARPSILSAAYLVNRDRLTAFTQTVADLQRTWDMAGFTIGVSGPWPAYDFARLGLGGQQAEEARVLLGPLSEPGGAWPTRQRDPWSITAHAPAPGGSSSPAPAPMAD
jgi:hypothetical protein